MIAAGTRVRLAGGETGTVRRVISVVKGVVVRNPLLIVILDERRSNGDKLVTAFEDEVEVCS